MSRAGVCPVCERGMRLPMGARGRKVRCVGCNSMLQIGPDDGERHELVVLQRGEVPAASAAAADDAAVAAAAAAPAAGRACPQCGADAGGADTFCGACGVELTAPVDANDERLRQVRLAAARKRKGRGSAMRKETVRNAGRWLLALGVLFALSGFLQKLSTRDLVAQARASLIGYDDPDELVQVGEETMTIGELRASIDFQADVLPAISWGLAALMLGLFFWARKSPFPALLTGLCTYLVVIAGSAVVQPATLLQGPIIKVLAIAGLVGGLKAAVSQRAFERRQLQNP